MKMHFAPKQGNVVIEAHVIANLCMSYTCNIEISSQQVFCK